MKLLRRRFLKLAAGVVAAPAFPPLASADDYPALLVRIIAGFSAGGGRHHGAPDRSEQT